MARLSVMLLGAIGITFLLQLMTGGLDGWVTGLFIFAPSVALSQPWRFITSIFLHGGMMHLLFNAYALFMFGSILERRVSSTDFLVLFFGAGLLGSVLYWLTYVIGIMPYPVPALGASGAIYGILGAVAILLPDLRIFFWFFPMRMREAAILWVLIEFLGTFDMGSGIASAAHLGGLIFGLAWGWMLKKRMEKPQASSYGWYA